MIIPDNVTVYMNGRAYYAHVCGFYWEGKRLSLQIDTSCLKGGGVEADRTDPPRREITVRAESGGKSVNVTYDPHDAEAVEAAEVWRKALFADGAQFKAVAPVAVKGGDSVTFAEPPKFDLDGFLKRIQREGYCCQSGSFSEKPAETVKRGHWEKSNIPCEKYVCSVCGGACWYYDYGGDVAKSRYCPNCGARMEGVT